MKHKWKRLTSLVLALAMCLSLLSATAWAEALPEADEADTAVSAQEDTTTEVELTVTYGQTEARGMLELINDFRTGDDAWYWNEDNETKTTCTDLKELTYDYTLEAMAMQRAAEIALSYSHTRPDGETCWTVYDDYAYTWYSVGENIAAGQTTAENAFVAWQETNYYYSGQGHRRNMLSSSYTAVGIGHVTYNGRQYWVQVFCKPKTLNTTPTTANDSEATVSINVLSSLITSTTLTASPTSYDLSCNNANVAVPTLTASLIMANTSPKTARTVTVVSPTWSSGNTAVATVDNDKGKVTVVTAGSTTITASALGQTVSVPVTVSHGDTETRNAKDATCTEEGYTGDDVCTVCGKTVMEGETIPATGHTPKEAVVENNVAATCTTDGSYDSVVYCSVCNAELSREAVSVPATGHTAAEAVVENNDAPTCTEDGSYDSVVYCSVCDAELSRTTITVEATGHTAAEAVVESYVAPTCDSPGYYDTVVYCSVCGAELSSDMVSVPATGHTAAEAVVENNVDPTCVAPGSYHSVVYCSVCGDEITRETVTVPATGIHTYVLDEDASTAATCTKDGKNVYVCSGCGDSYTVTVEATGHTTELQNAKEATCEVDGYTGDTVCTVCDETITSGEVISATGHSWDEGVVTTAATCTVPGVMTYTCTTCGATKTEEIAATGHTTELQNAKAATCTEDGYTGDEVCTVCNETITSGQTIPATGHTEGEAVTENYVAATCTEDGSYDSVVYCSVCGKELSRTEITIEKTGHTAADPAVENEVPATHTTDGSYDSVVYCSVCGEELSRTKVVVAAGGHTAGEAQIENYVAPTCTKNGSYDSVVYCTECGEEMSRVTITLDATGHTPGEAVEEKKVAATCVEAGSYDSVIYCSVCGAEISRETVTVPATGIHTYVLDEDASTAATCTTDGGNVYVCSVCRDSYTETVEATGHSYVATVTAPTCTEKGYTTYTCSACGDSYTADETEATGHTTELRNAKAATCTEDGYTGDEVCTVCGETITAGKTIAATGHAYGEDGVCANCGETKATTASTATLTDLATTAEALSESDYTASSWADLQAAVETANAVLSDENATESETAAAIAALNDAVAALKAADTSTDTSTNTGSSTDTSTDTGAASETVAVPAATKITSLVNRAKGVKVTWKAVDGATSYQVYRKIGSGSWKKVKTTSSTTWTDTAAKKNGTKYQYKVYAVNEGGKSKASATSKIYRLTAKHFTRAKNVSGKKISLKWTRNTKATGYIIQYSTSKSFSGSSTKTVKIKGNKNLTTTLKNLKKGKKYYIRMRPYKTSGGLTSYAGWSKVKTVKVKK